ncbi:hypothetical protein, partial [Streptomyces albidoflavus]|uniref:hypothetical protein n=1 Tax=Streptomyces albidoflavus TaxID=1886 RepID=UPI001C3EBDA2
MTPTTAPGARGTQEQPSPTARGGERLVGDAGADDLVCTERRWYLVACVNTSAGWAPETPEAVDLE